MDENPILCGVLDLPLRNGTEQHILDNVCFGQVKWLKPEPKPEQVTCPICKRLMTLLMQVSCPFPDAPGDLSRKLIVAVCLAHAARVRNFLAPAQLSSMPVKIFWLQLLGSSFSLGRQKLKYLLRKDF